MRAVRWSFSMQSFAWLWAICGVCSRFGKSWIGVRKGEKVLHTMEMARPVVRRGRRKETTSCEFAGRFLGSHFTICIFVHAMCKKCASECITRPLVQAFHMPRRLRFYGGSGVYRPPRREMAGIPGVSRLTFLTLPRFSRVPGPCSYRFSLFSLWICHVLRGFCTRCCHVFSILRMHAGSCGCIWRRAGTYWRLRAVAAFTAEPTADATAETAMPASSARVAKTPGRRSWSRRVGPSTTRWSPMKTRASLWP